MQDKTGEKRSDHVPPDKYRVSIIISSREQARVLVRDKGFDLVQTQVLDDGKRSRLTFFANEEEIKVMQDGGYSPTVGENVSEAGLKRQTEVAKGDRFDGGRIAPKGLGRKIGTKHQPDRGPN